MAQWTKKQRLEAVMNGEPADRPLISAWRHFPERENDPVEFAAAMLEFQEKYDWDFLKLQPRGIYQQENWGNVYDYAHYNDVIPALVRHLIHSADDLQLIQKLPGTSGTFGEQLTSLRLIKARANEDIPVFATLFTPIGVLLNLCGFRSVGRYRKSPREESGLIRLLQEDPEGVHRALHSIAETLAEYAGEVLKAGADGVYYAALGMAREHYMTLGEWNEFVRPYDLIVLEALKAKPVILHTCGIDANPQRFADWPIEALHWAESASGNPSIEESWSWIGSKAISGGVDERLFGTGAADSIHNLAVKAAKAHRNRPFILSPECSISVHTFDDELQAFRSSVETI